MDPDSENDDDCFILVKNKPNNKTRRHKMQRKDENWTETVVNDAVIENNLHAQEQIIVGEVIDNLGHYASQRRISIDGMMKAPPVYEPEEVEKLQESETEYKERGESLPQTALYNTRALSKHASTYELEKFEKNALIIFNQVNLEGYSKPRLGTEKDVEALTKTFSKFGFDVLERTDMAKDEILKELKTFSETDFTEYGCVAVAVLTHGSSGGLIRAKDQPYSELEIVNHFKARDKPTLLTKPRILIIQACRGTNAIQGVQITSSKIRKDLEQDVVEPYYLPVESDMLVLHSSYMGNPSHRDELNGSWFIQSLCNKIDHLSPTHDFESIVTEVKREVAIDRQHEVYNRRTFEIDTNKQMPVLTSTLIRKLYLRRYGDESSDVKISTETDSSSNEILNSLAPGTPLQLQFGPCSCFLEHFSYIRNCLRYFLEDNPQDATAQAYLELANTFEDGVHFNAPKEKMLNLICIHLMNNCKDSQFYKYLYIYKN